MDFISSNIGFTGLFTNIEPDNIMKKLVSYNLSQIT